MKKWLRRVAGAACGIGAGVLHTVGQPELALALAGACGTAFGPEVVSASKRITELVAPIFKKARGEK